MKSLEKKIIKDVYRLEAKKTAGYLLSRTFLVILSLFLTFIFASVTIEILNEQNSFDLFDFLRDDFEVIKKYFINNLFGFYQELPQPLTYLFLTSILLVLVMIFIFIKNFEKIKNRVISIYKFWFPRKEKV